MTTFLDIQIYSPKLAIAGGPGKSTRNFWQKFRNIKMERGKYKYISIHQIYLKANKGPGFFPTEHDLKKVEMKNVWLRQELKKG